MLSSKWKEPLKQASNNIKRALGVKRRIPAHSLLADMLQNPRTNVYTIEKKGVKKLIYQTPWYVEGEFMGFMELSMEIPFEMKHRVRGEK